MGFADGKVDIQRGRSIHLTGLTGGTEGIGAALGGTLSHASIEREVNVLDSGFATEASRTAGEFDGQLSFMPFDGFKAVGGGTLVETDSASDFTLGSLTGEAGGTGTLDSRAGLCLGSAQGTESCGGNTAFLEVGAPVTGAVTLGGTNIVSADFSTNRVVAALGQGQFSVKGAIGGTISVGDFEIGRPIPIDIEIPRTSAVTSLGNQRQTQTVRNSFMAVPGKSSSDNETGGRHRAPLREAVANIRAAVDSAVNGRHAKQETED